MHRTQIYFDEQLFTQVKKAAQHNNVSMSSYIRDVLQRDINNKKENAQPLDFSKFSGLWQDYDISQDDLRSKAWK